MEMKNGVLKSDYDALVALYNSTNGPKWRHSDGWLTDKSVSDWYGVMVEDGRVTVLDLYSNQLSGSIPPEIGNLTKLKGLYLHNNQLNGSIPREIGNLVKLTWLYLGNNQLTGGLPESIKLPNCEIWV